jgi:hypothetical protein
MNKVNETPIFLNLSNMIRNTTIRYTNEFVWQDVELTEEFQFAYENYLEKTNYSIEFHKSTAVITSPLSKYIFVPNQWFVIASYVVEVYEELYKYKDCFKKVAITLGKRPDMYAKQLRDNASITDKNEFMDCVTNILKRNYSNQQLIFQGAQRLWRFVNDYSWWSGQKTIDRTDFHVSVILNMLNLVNTSQGYVADIVSAYANDYGLRLLVRKVDGFTVNLTCNTINESYSCCDDNTYDMKKNNDENYLFQDSDTEYNTTGRTKIKISGNKLKEIKYKKM